MAEANPPKGDRIGNDFHEGPNPNPGGDVDTGDSLVPPYDDRTDELNERSEGPERMLRGEDPPSDTDRPGQLGATAVDGGEMAPDNVGESLTRRGEDVGGKEPGRFDTGADDVMGQRPTGESTARDTTGVDPQAGPDT